MRIPFIRIWLVAASLLASGCGDTPVALPDVKQLTLRFKDVSGRVGVLEVGERLQVIAETRDSAGQLLSNADVHFSSTTPQFFDVGQDGVVKGKAAGSGYVVGTAQGAAMTVRDSLLITVAVPVFSRQ